MKKRIDIWMCISVIILCFLIVYLATEIRETQRNYEEATSKLAWEIAIMEDEITTLKMERDFHEYMIEQNAENIMTLQAAIEEHINSEVKLNYDYEYVLRVVAAESRGESLEGQMAVAQCIRETSNVTGMTPEQVVKAPNQYASPVSLELVTDSVREACERVFINGESVTDEPIRYFYSTNNGFVSKWHENSLTYVMTIGCHKFFKK